MEKNPTANTEDMGLIPGLERFHMPQSNEAHKPQILSLRVATTEPVSCNS